MSFFLFTSSLSLVVVATAALTLSAIIFFVVVCIVARRRRREKISYPRSTTKVERSERRVVVADQPRCDRTTRHHHRGRKGLWCYGRKGINKKGRTSRARVSAAEIPSSSSAGKCRRRSLLLSISDASIFVPRYYSSRSCEQNKMIWREEGGSQKTSKPSTKQHQLPWSKHY